MSGKGGGNGEPIESEMATSTAMIDTIDVQVLESFPVQVNVVAKGNFPDGCTTLGNVIAKETDNAFEVSVETQRPVDALCTQALVPFEETISLDVLGLMAGVYGVNINGATSTFELLQDNIAPDSDDVITEGEETKTE